MLNIPLDQLKIMAKKSPSFRYRFQFFVKLVNQYKSVKAKLASVNAKKVNLFNFFTLIKQRKSLSTVLGNLLRAIKNWLTRAKQHAVFIS